MEAKIEEIKEMFAKDLQQLKNKEAEMNNTLEGIHNRITEAEAQINDLEDRMVEIIAIEQNIEERMKRKKLMSQTKGQDETPGKQLIKWR